MRTFRFCARVVTVVVVIAAVLVTAVVLRLMAGPVDLDFLGPVSPRNSTRRAAKCGSRPSGSMSNGAA